MNQNQDQIGFLEKLAAIRAAHCDELPTPELATLTRSTARLRRSGILQQCLQVGETAPNFEFINDNNLATSLYDCLQQGPMVINFFRGYWCSFCETELDAFRLIKETLTELGCQYLAVSPQGLPVETGSRPYQLIFDRNNQIATKFKIVYDLADEEIELYRGWGLNLDEINQSPAWTLPLPATYLIGRDRTICYQFADVDIRSRCDPEDLIAELRRIPLK